MMNLMVLFSFGKKRRDKFSLLKQPKDANPRTTTTSADVKPKLSLPMIPEKGRSSKNLWRLFSFKKSSINGKTKRSDSEKFMRRFGYSRAFKNELYDDVEPRDKRSRSPTLSKPVVPAVSQSEITSRQVLSMLSSCANDFIEDETFRFSVHQRCVLLLNSCGSKDTKSCGIGVLSALKEAIGSVERAISEGFADKLELRRIAVQLSIIAGSKLTEPSNLAACAHLYLSVLCKIQNKDAISAKHLLRVFVRSPHHARTILLPELWEILFLPQMSDLKAWIDREADSGNGASDFKRLNEFRKKIYDDLLDAGTSKFAILYKDWLLENRE